MRTIIRQFSALNLITDVSRLQRYSDKTLSKNYLAHSVVQWPNKEMIQSQPSFNISVTGRSGTQASILVPLVSSE